jgi:pimeloyl-ACP methyl ester carboxylesterase
MGIFYMRTKNAALGLLFFFSAAVLLDAKAQTPKPTKPTFVIVHGAWGGSWAFRKVDTLLVEKGCIVYRPSLTGLGERVHLATSSVGLNTHIDDVVNMILFEDLRDVVLVGHSYGGMVITGVAGRVPDRIRRLIYIDAFVPNDGESVQNVIGARADWIKPMIQGDYIVPPWVKPEQPLPKDVPQPLKTFMEPLALKNKAALQLPATYILTVDAGREAKDDNFAAQSERAKTRGWTIVQLTADHNPQWSAPEALVDLLFANK